MNIKKEHLSTLWYENENGDKAQPLGAPVTTYYQPPAGYHYQHSLSTSLSYTILRSVVESEVKSCDHPEEFVVRTGGWIDEIEGRECKKCGGTQTRSTGTNWPKDWEAYGCNTIASGSSGWDENLVTEMVRQGKKVGEAILIVALACERCLNVLLHQYGLKGGYAECSKDWLESRTSCKFCEGMDPVSNVMRFKPWVAKL
jgi:hypothetical protein